MRKLTNSLLSGQFLALLLSQGVFLLNPQLPHTPGNVLSVWASLAITYGLASGLAFWVLLQLLELVRNRELNPAWLSFRILTWLLTLSLTLGALYLWVNLVDLRIYLPSETIRVMAIAATVVTGAAAVLFVLGLFHFSFGRRAAALGYLLFVLSLAGSAIAPLLLRPLPVPPDSPPRMPLEDTPSARRLTIIGLEGASLSYVLPAIAEGQLPNFARLIEGGASGALRTLYPTESLAVWTSIATGKLPRQHGLMGFYRYRFPAVEVPVTVRPRGLDFALLDRIGILNRSAATSSMRRTQTFWSILNRFGVRLGLVRWWGTYPAEPVDGFVVSEYFHRQVREGFDPPLPRLTHPPEIFERFAPLVVLPEEVREETLAAFVDQSIEIPGDDFPWRKELTRALADDSTYHRLGKLLREEQSVDVFAVYYFGLDIVGHYFSRYDRPGRFGDVSDEEERKYGEAVAAYYRYLDSILGEYLQERREDEIIVVVSGHGMDPLSLAGRVVERFRGNPHLSGYHENAPEGLLILNGPGITAGSKLQGASVLDLTPTLLYLMGLPLGQDMDGVLLDEALEEELIRNQPLTFISSYHNFLIEPRGNGGLGLGEDGSPLDAIDKLVESPDLE